MMNTTQLSQRDDIAPAADPEAGVRLLRTLKSLGYRFITPTPFTHRKILGRPGKALANDLRDVFGWSLPFSDGLLPRDVIECLRSFGGLREGPCGYQSAYRVSTLGPDLFLHAAFPPSADNAVFFGPDTYRFARYLRHVIGSAQVERVIDIGAGSGAGAVAAQRAGGARSVILTDINPVALATAQVNLKAADVTAEFRLGSGLDVVGEQADLIIANPPFIAGDSGRTYRDGGDMRGARLSLDWALAGAAQLKPQGRFVLYTGSSVVDGADLLHAALSDRLPMERFHLHYEEIDPDIFGGQLSAKGYEDVERIAAIGAVIYRR